MKILLSVLPFFQDNNFLIPHLGIASISAYIKEKIKNIEIKTIDLRIDKEANSIWGNSTLPNITFKNQYISDIYDLPLIASVIKNYKDNKNIKSILEPNETQVKLWSLERAFLPDFIMDKLKKTNYFALKNLKYFEGYDLVGFSLYTTNIYLSIIMALLIKHSYPKTKIVFGGPQITQSKTSRDLLLLSNIADYVIIGEGEEPFYQLINSILNNEDTKNIIGLKSLSNIHDIDTFSQNMNLEILPVPDYSSINFDLFNPKVIPIYSNRGCPFRCHFCSEHSLFGKKFKRRGPEKVYNDMKILSSKYNIFDFSISDSLINSSNQWLEEFSKVLTQNNAYFNWGGYFRAQLKNDLVKELRETGLSVAILGVESFSQDTLDDMNKKKVNEEIINSIDYLVNNDINTFVNLFVGYPGESENDFLQTFEKTLEFYKKYKKENKLNRFKITIRTFQVRPFSNIYKSLNKFGIETENWLKHFDEKYHPIELKEIFENTLYTFSVKGIDINEVWHRYFLMKQLKNSLNS